MENFEKPALNFSDPQNRISLGSKIELNGSVREEFRAIKRHILKSAFSNDLSTDFFEPLNRIMVTSVGDRAGKTFTAFNLAKSIADERDKNVLLVDADVINSTLSNITEPVAHEGLIDFLSDPLANISERIYHTDRPNMKFMPTGRDHYLANELFSSEKMSSLMKEFSERYQDRLVIFDAPSLLDVNESVALTSHMDQVIILIEEGHTKEKDIKKVLSRLPQNIKTHFILNKTLQGNGWRGWSRDNGHEFKSDDSSALHGSNPVT
jgi:protein-tyrosine kinase